MMGDSWDVTSDLTPLSDYDEKASRERISLKWLILKSHLHVNEIPKEITSPFYVDLDGNFSLKPILVNLLSSGELYCQACANLFYEWQLPFHDISSVICSLARKGFYVDEDNGIGVTESVLKQTSPLRLNSHLLLIEALMEAFVKTCITIEASVKAVKETGAKFSPSSDLPEDHEDAILFWIGRVYAMSVNGRRTFADVLDNNEITAELRKSSSSSSSTVKNLDDLSDGVKLCVLLSFYFGPALFSDAAPPVIPASTSSSSGVVVAEEPTSFADSIHNIKLFLAASSSLFPDFPFGDVGIEDVLYSPAALRPIVLCMLSQIFFSLSSRGFLKRETYPRDAVLLLPRVKLDLAADDRNGNASSSGDADDPASTTATFSPSTTTADRRPQSLFSPAAAPPAVPPISKVTKQSFVQQAGLRSSNCPTPDSPSFPAHNNNNSKSPSSSALLSSTTTPGGARRLSADPSADLLPSTSTRKTADAFDFGDQANNNNNYSAKTRPGTSSSSQRGQSKPRPRSAVDLPPTNGSFYSALSSSGDHGEAAAAASFDSEKTSLLENCDLDDVDESGKTVTRRSNGGSTTGAAKSMYKSESSPEGGGGGSGDFSRKVPRKKWRASAGEEVENNPFPPAEHNGLSSSSSSAKGDSISPAGRDAAGGTWSKSSSPLVLSSSSSPHPGKTGQTGILASKSFNVGEKVITEQAARAANIPVIGGSESGGGDESLRVQFFLKKSPAGGPPKPLNSDTKAKVTSPFIPKFGDVEMTSGDGGEEDVVVTADPGASAAKRSSLGMCGKVFLNGNNGGNNNNNNGENGESNNRLSALFGSCDNFPSVLGHSGGEKGTGDGGDEHKSAGGGGGERDEARGHDGEVTPGSTSFAEISQKVAVLGKPAEQVALASPKSSLKSASKSSTENVERLQNPTTWGAIGHERVEAENREEQQQQLQQQQQPTTPNGPNGRSPLSVQLAAMRMRLEEKKRAIERDKIKAENRANKDRQRFGKTAFLKVIGANVGQPSHESILEERETPGTSPGQTPIHDSGKSLSIKPEATSSSSKSDRRDSETALQSVPEEAPPSAEGKNVAGDSSIPKERLLSEGNDVAGSSSSSSAVKKERLKSEGNESTGSNQSRKSSSGNCSVEAASSNSLKSRVRTISSSSDPGRDTPSPSSSVGTDNQCIDQLNASLFELQSEIKRLSIQQEMLKSQQLQSQFSQPPGDFTTPAPPVFSPPRPDMINGGFVAYNPQMLPPSPYSPYPLSLGMAGMPPPPPHQPNPPTIPQQPVGGPIMMPTFSPSLNNLVQQQQPSLPLQTAQYGSMASIPSATSSPLPPFYASQGNLNLNHHHPNSVVFQESAPSPRESNGGGGVDHRLLAETTRSSGEAPPDYSSGLDSRGSDVIVEPRIIGDDDDDDGDIGVRPDDRRSDSTTTHPPSEQCYISFGGGGDHVVVDRWKRDSEGDLSLLKEDEMNVNRGGGGGEVPPISEEGEGGGGAVAFHPQKSPRNVAWMTPPSSAGKVRESLAMQTPTTTNSTLSVSDTRRTPSTDESRENVQPTTPEVQAHQQQQQRVHVPQPCVMLLDASGNPQEVLDLEAQESLPEPDNHEAERERKRQEMITRQLKRREEQEQKRLKREAEAAAKKEEAQRKFEEQERKKEAERQKKEAILKEYKVQKNEERLGPIEKEIKTMQRQSAKRKPATTTMTTSHLSPLPKGVSPDRYARGRSPSHQNLVKPSSLSPASPMLCTSIQDIQAGYAPIEDSEFTHVPVMRNEGGGLRAGSVTRKLSRPLSTHGGSVSTLNDNQSETQSMAGDYAGPRLYVQPSQRTNKKIIANSLAQCCLAGAVNNDSRNKVLAELENSDAKHFLILFRDSGCQYRGVFGFDPDAEVVEKICGSGPKTVVASMVEKFFKYSSGGKKFTEIYAKQMSVTIDAFTIHNHLWQTAKARNGSKTRPVSMYN